jgi:chromate transporter
MLVGFVQGRWAGACAAWLGFTLPSALLMGAAGVILSSEVVPLWLQIVCRLLALWIVAHAVWGMARVHCATKGTRFVGILAIIFSVLGVWGGGSSLATWIPSLTMIGGALIGIIFFEPKSVPRGLASVSISYRAGVICLSVFLLLLVALPFFSEQSVYAGLYRVGALVFGGGHVVLPLIQQELVSTKLLDAETFATGYGLVQAMPGPLFSIGSFIAGATDGLPGIIPGTIMIFAPSALLVFGLLPWWKTLQQIRVMQKAFPGINAVVVGLVVQAWLHLVLELVAMI